MRDSEGDRDAGRLPLELNGTAALRARDGRNRQLFDGRRQVLGRHWKLYKILVGGIGGVELPGHLVDDERPGLLRRKRVERVRTTGQPEIAELQWGVGSKNGRFVGAWHPHLVVRYQPPEYLTAPHRRPAICNRDGRAIDRERVAFVRADADAREALRLKRRYGQNRPQYRYRERRLFHRPKR